MLVTHVRKQQNDAMNNKFIYCTRERPSTALEPWCPGKIHRPNDGIGSDGEPRSYQIHPE